MSPTHFWDISYRFKYIDKYIICYFQNVGQGHGVQFSQLHRLMAKSKPTHDSRTFLHWLLLFQIYQFSIFSKNWVKGQDSSFHYCSIRWQMSRCPDVFHTILRYLLLFQRYTN